MTTPYTTGSITLTNGSAVVTGVGTAWQTALIAGGTLYAEADGNPLPILSVDSNTQITAAIKWKGATGSFPYAIMRDTAYGQQTVANANALATYLQRLDNASVAALASIAGQMSAGKVPRGLSANTMEWFIISDFIKQVLDDPDAATARGSLGIGNVSSSGSSSTIAGSLLVNSNGSTFALQRNNANAIDVEAFQTSNSATKHSIDLNRYGGGVTVRGQDVWVNDKVPYSTSGFGYINFPNGFKIQWGYDNSGQSDSLVTFPIAFTTFSRVVVNLDWVPNANQAFTCAVSGASTTSFYARKRYVEGGVVNPIGAGAHWIAIGF
ncbi:hypothetical protein [Ensifer sp. ENS08]|uniref:gp53-like domain-containing protein n=1 Tax=Ensifer sp. ENS08 TaxID=2769273 RepID=UPI0017870CC3|nr:hypothetical protein [Ensifer sp. ENS08]MBD9573574.1 hypothetical protein [Ensifer sp. ENS08]